MQSARYRVRWRSNVLSRHDQQWGAERQGNELTFAQLVAHWQLEIWLAVLAVFFINIVVILRYLRLDTDMFFQHRKMNTQKKPRIVSFVRYDAQNYVRSPWIAIAAHAAAYHFSEKIHFFSSIIIYISIFAVGAQVCGFSSGTTVELFFWRHHAHQPVDGSGINFQTKSEPEPTRQANPKVDTFIRIWETISEAETKDSAGCGYCKLTFVIWGHDKSECGGFVISR